jgi:hypothetical protein
MMGLREGCGGEMKASFWNKMLVGKYPFSFLFRYPFSSVVNVLSVSPVFWMKQNEEN